MDLPVEDTPCKKSRTRCGLCVWRLPLDVVLKFRRIVARTSIPSPFRAERSIFWIDRNLCTHLLTNGHLGYFHLLAVARSLWTHVNKRLSACPSQLLWGVPRRGVAGSFGHCVLSFPKPFWTLLGLHPFVFSSAACEGSSSVTSSPTLLLFFLFKPKGHEVVSGGCGSDLYFLSDQQY